MYRGDLLAKRLSEIDNVYELARFYDSEVRISARQQAIIRHRRITAGHPVLLEYHEFLESPYWLWLTRKLKMDADYRCQHCGRGHISQGRLEVHHKTYLHRGFEYPNHLDDLVVLCWDCHKRIHQCR